MKKCIACKKNKFRNLENIYGIASPVIIKQCIYCGLAYQDPLPTKKQLQVFYNKFYGKKNYRKNQCGESYPSEMYIKKNSIKEIKKIEEIEKYKKGGRLLDVGVGKGFFISELSKDRKWKVYGLEYSRPAASELNKKYGFNVRAGEITTNSFKDLFFDVITMQSVLEHIPDQDKNLAAVNKKLKKGGLFVFNVPNIKSFEYFVYKIFRRSFSGFIPQHLYYYSPDAIEKMLYNNGFKIIKITSKRHESVSFPPIRPLMGVLNFPLKLIFEYSFLGNLNFGNSLFVYAKKIK